MDNKIKMLLGTVDHTLLKQEAVWSDIKKICDEAVEYHTASVCIPPSFVKEAAQYLEGKTPVCTVIGFPNGYQTTKVKVYETLDAIENGAKEIDMVINIGWAKAGLFDKIQEEISQIKKACGVIILKVIIETCLLNEEEKIKLCDVVTRSGADFIKTSTGFSTDGATPEDIKIFSKHVGKDVKIKAAGGIATLSDGETFIELGAHRLGTSRMIKLAQNTEADGY